MQLQERLAGTLVDESRAYGYTLTIWGAGAMLVSQYDVPNPLEVFAYVGCALVGFTALTVVSFGGILVQVERSGSVETAAEMVHLGATFINLVVSLALVVVLADLGVPGVVTFALVGFQTTVGYSVLLLGEEVIGQKLQSIPD